MEGGLYKYPMKNISRTEKFLPTFGQVKGIARVFNSLKCLGGIMHLKPTAECQISISQRWARTLPSLIYFSWDIYKDPLHIFFSNIKVDI
jgi:hypothetical protein